MAVRAAENKLWMAVRATQPGETFSDEGLYKGGQLNSLRHSWPSTEVLTHSGITNIRAGNE